MNWFNVLERAAWTAVQAFLASLSIEAIVEGVADPWKALAVAALGAAISGIKTLAQDRLSQIGS